MPSIFWSLVSAGQRNNTSKVSKTIAGAPSFKRVRKHCRDTPYHAARRSDFLRFTCCGKVFFPCHTSSLSELSRTSWGSHPRSINVLGSCRIIVLAGRPRAGETVHGLPRERDPLHRSRLLVEIAPALAQGLAPACFFAVLSSAVSRSLVAKVKGEASKPITFCLPLTRRLFFFAGGPSPLSSAFSPRSIFVRCLGGRNSNIACSVDVASSPSL